MINNFQLLKVEVDLTCETTAKTSGLIIADSQPVDFGAHMPDIGRRGTIEGITVLDKDDQGGALDLVFLDAANSLGTEHSAPNISDANAAAVIAVVPVNGYTDLGGCQVARPLFDPIPFQLAPGVKLQIGAISRDTKTYTAVGLRVKLLIRLENVVAQDL